MSDLRSILNNIWMIVFLGAGAFSGCVKWESVYNNVYIVYDTQYTLNSVDEYVYDAEGKLYGTRRLAGGGSGWESGWSFPPGSYTIVAWGNLSDRNRTDNVTDLERARVVPAMRHEADESVFDRGDCLFYGYQTCVVPDAGDVHDPVRLSIQMNQAYSDFTFVVPWNLSDMETQTDADDYFFRLEGMSSRTSFEPGNVTGEEYLPSVNAAEAVAYRSAASREDGGRLRARFIAHRLAGNSHPVVSLWKGNRQIMQNIDLHLYFQAVNIDPSVRQEQIYELRLEKRGDKIVVSPPSGLNIFLVDWEEIRIDVDL